MTRSPLDDRPTKTVLVSRPGIESLHQSRGGTPSVADSGHVARSVNRATRAERERDDRVVHKEDEVTDPAWEAAFVDELRRGLATIAARGSLTVERADVAAGEVITVLRLDRAPAARGHSGPHRPPIRRGRVESLSWLWSMIFPHAPDFMAEAWVEDLYPPHHPDPATIVEGVHWFRGRTPGMSHDEINQLTPALNTPPPPRWQGELPPNVRPEHVSHTASYEPPLPHHTTPTAD